MRHHFFLAVLLAAVVGLLLSPGAPRPAARAAMPTGPVASAPVARADLDWGRMPVYFVENCGQFDERVAYYVEGADKTLYFTAEGVTFALVAPPPEPRAARRDPHHRRDLAPVRRWIVKLGFVGANRGVRPVGEAPQAAVVSYFRGRPEEWQAGLPTYGRLVYRDLWPGIDLVYEGTAGRLKYRFVVHPGADPARIRLAYRGAGRVALNAAGQLEVTTPVASFADDVPIAYQELDGRRVAVDAAYHLSSALRERPDTISDPQLPDTRYRLPAREFSFILGTYDPTRALILDPAVLVYCGYVGGAGDDLAFDLAVDALGRAYVVGTTTSGEDSFPVEVGPDLTLNGQDGHWGAFVARVNAAGTALEYCGYIGGAGDDVGTGIALDAEGNAYVTGWTDSTEATFPVLVGPDLTFNGEVDVFVARVNAAGTALDYCGYIGGADYDWMSAIAVDGAGRAYVTGMTRSDESSFPVTVGPDLTFNSPLDYIYDAFVARVNAAGTALEYCGYIGGGANESDAVITVDGLGRAYVAGTTESTESSFPVVGGPDLTFNGGERDGFVARVDAAGTALEYCGYLGGSSLDSAWGLAVDGEGRAYLTGYTESGEATFPVQVGPDLTHNGAGDAFVARVRADGLGLDYCGYLGGAGDDDTYDVAADAAGNAYVTGWTASGEATLPVRGGPDLTFNGGADAWIARVSAAGTALDYCGYIGGSGVDWGEAIAVDGAGQAYVAGITYSGEATFPVRVGPDLTYNGGLRDTFVARVRWFGDSIPYYLPQVFHALH